MENLDQIAKLWLQKKIDEFVDQYDPNASRDEFWMNTYENVKDVLDDFYQFINRDAEEKEKRRKLYEELKKEFE